MTEYAFVGGPLDGKRMETSGARVFRILRPVPFNAPTDLSFSTWEYMLVDGAYRYETLIGDAVAQVRVTAQLMADPEARHLVRGELRRYIGALDPNGEIDGVIWRLDYDPLSFTFGVRAIVGGRRVSYGLAVRDERKFTGRLPWEAMG